MSTIFFQKDLKILLIDYSILDNRAPNYINLSYLDSISNNNISSTHITTKTNLFQTIKTMCKNFRPNAILVLNLLSHFGHTCATQTINRLRNMTGNKYTIYLGGDIEIACAKVFEKGFKKQNHLDSFGKHIQQELDIEIISAEYLFSNEMLNHLISMLKIFGIQDSLEIVLPRQKKSYLPACNNEWTMEIKSNHFHKSFEAINERLKRLKCNNISISINLNTLKVPIWQDKDRFVSWLSALSKQNSYVEITLLLTLPYVGKELLTELFKCCNIVKCEVQFLPLSLSSKNPESLFDIVDVCKTQGIPVANRGYLATETTTWVELQNIWQTCDRIGKNFLEILGAVPMTNKRGWCKDLCVLLSTSKLLYEYQMTSKYLKIIKSMTDIFSYLHSSVLSFCNTRLEQAQNIIFNEISKYGISNIKYEITREAIKKIAEEITDVRKTFDYISINKDSKVSNCNSDIAVVIGVNNNESYLRLCLNSIYLNTERAYDLFIVDYGSVNSICDNFPTNGTLNYIHLCRPQLKSYAIALGLTKAWGYKYIFILSANACAIQEDWLNEMIRELDASPKIGAIGLQHGKLDYHDHKDKFTSYLHKYIVAKKWRSELAPQLFPTEDDLMKRLTVENTSCFSELTGSIQLYKGHILRSIGLPIVEDHILKHHHWDSELSMRVLGCGYEIETSTTAKKKIKFFNEYNYSQIPEVSKYAIDLQQTQMWLKDNKHNKLAMFLDSNPYEKTVTVPSYS